MRELRFENVSLSYGRVAALSAVSFVCAPAKVTCLAGPNGAGKSTALAAAAGIVRPHSGRIMLGAGGVRPHAPHPGVSYLPQNSSFPALLTVREILRFAASVSGAGDADWSAALRVTGVAQILDRRAGELSGGWERRLGLAWALLQPADVLLLDEPLAGLDPETLDLLIEHAGRCAAAGKTVVMTTHEFEALDALGPAAVVLEQSRVAAQFPAHSGPLRALYRSALMRSRAKANAEQVHV